MMTRYEKQMKAMTVAALAELNIRLEVEEIWDENYDGGMECCGTDNWYVASDGYTSWDYEEVVNHEIEWLMQEVCD